jgi:hypothetical protein
MSLQRPASALLLPPGEAGGSGAEAADAEEPLTPRTRVFVEHGAPFGRLSSVDVIASWQRLRSDGGAGAGAAGEPMGRREPASPRAQRRAARGELKRARSLSAGSLDRRAQGFGRVLLELERARAQRQLRDRDVRTAAELGEQLVRRNEALEAAVSELEGEGEAQREEAERLRAQVALLQRRCAELAAHNAELLRVQKEPEEGSEEDGERA